MQNVSLVDTLSRIHRFLAGNHEGMRFNDSYDSDGEDELKTLPEDWGGARYDPGLPNPKEEFESGMYQLRTRISDELKRLHDKCEYIWMRRGNTYSLFEHDTKSNTEKKISTMTEFYNHSEYDEDDESSGGEVINGFHVVMEDNINELFYTESVDGWTGECVIYNGGDETKSSTRTCTGLENIIATVTTWIKQFI
jgi:hypothetical protein